MKMLTYNIRGLGSKAKRRECRELISRYNIDFCCIQETKLEMVDSFVCRAIWGQGNFNWSFKPSEGRAGGIISIWNSDKFICSSSWFMEDAIVVNGFWKSDDSHCVIINVYAPCPLPKRRELWDRILLVTNQFQMSNICLLGDFNSVRTASERAGRNSILIRRDVECFDNFIRNSGLIDLPLHGRTFSWYRPDGSCKSRLDIILTSSSCNFKIIPIIR
ncbi:hypothetical protein ACS0TY_022426 [Phlomoides rotata]